jgi:hypothetical protein
MLGTRCEETLDSLNDRNFIRYFDVLESIEGNYRKNISRNLLILWTLDTLLPEFFVLLFFTLRYEETFHIPYLAYMAFYIRTDFYAFGSPAKFVDWAHLNLV